MSIAMSYPALTGEVVTQAHADHCAAHGHATHTSGTDVSPWCPRCGANRKAPGTKVQGAAAAGDKVVYRDQANQEGFVWEVVTTAAENTDPKWGWSLGYGLKGAEGKTHYSDLRQAGWTFA